jgi:hypothetical protein
LVRKVCAFWISKLPPQSAGTFARALPFDAFSRFGLQVSQSQSTLPFENRNISAPSSYETA